MKLTDEFLGNTNEHDDDSWSDDGEWIINSVCGEEVQDTRDQVENVDNLFELESERDREEGYPVVVRRFTLVGRPRIHLILDSSIHTLEEVRHYVICVKLSCLLRLGCRAHHRLLLGRFFAELFRILGSFHLDTDAISATLGFVFLLVRHIYTLL